MSYRFPRAVFVDRNNLRKQLDHVMSELLEVITAYDAGEPAARVMEELIDAIHSLETACRIMQELYAVDVAALSAAMVPVTPLGNFTAQFADATRKWELALQAVNKGESREVVVRLLLLVIDSLNAACGLVERLGVSAEYIEGCVISKNRVRGYYCEA